MHLAAALLALVTSHAAAQAPVVFVASDERPELLDAFRAELVLRNEELVVDRSANAAPAGRMIVFVAGPTRIELRRPDGTVTHASLAQSVSTVDPRVFALAAASLLEPLPALASIGLPHPPAIRSLPAPVRLATQRIVRPREPRLAIAPQAADEPSPWSIGPRLGATLRLPNETVLPEAGLSAGYSFGVVRIETGVSVAATAEEFVVVIDPAGIALRVAGLDVGARSSVAIDSDGVALGGGAHVAWLWPVSNTVHLGPRADARLASRVGADVQEGFEAQVSLALAVEVTP